MTVDDHIERIWVKLAEYADNQEYASRRTIRQRLGIDPKIAPPTKIVLHPRASVAHVESMEAQIGFSLPLEYRRFILEIADGVRFGRWRLYPVDYAISMIDVSGELPIYYEGCTHWDVLLLTGPDAGTVWYDGSGIGKGLLPYSESGEVPMPVELADHPTSIGFLAWFEMRLNMLPLATTGTVITQE